MPEPTVHGRLSLKTKLGYGIGDLAANLVFQSILIYLLFYFTDVFGISPSVAGLVFFLSKIWDGISDPLMGYMADRTRTRWGSKRPFLLVGAIPLGLSFFLLFTPWPLNAFWKPVYALVMLLLVCTFYTVVNIPYGALTASLTRDANERAGLTGYRMFFAISGTLVVAGATKPLVALAATPQAGFCITAGVYGFFAAVLTLVTFASVREQEEPERFEKYGLRDIWSILKSNPPFLVLSAGMVLHLTAVGIMAAMVNYYFKYCQGRESFTTVAFLCIFVSAAVFLPLWVTLSRRLDKKTTFNLGMGTLALSLGAIYFIRGHEPMLLIPAFVFAGAGISTVYLSPNAMVPDTVEYSQWKIGLRREGILYGFYYFGQKFASAFAGFIAGIGLELVRFQPNTVQSETALEGIRVLTTIVPIAFILLGIGVIHFYPIDAAFHERILAKISAAKESA
ncbi:MAG: MFS transporter [Desulfobacterales bacterium]|nr:MFS transporter [Desulfobacterales bacterium]